MESITREELDELLSIENDFYDALVKRRAEKTRRGRNRWNHVLKTAQTAEFYHSQKLEQKTEIDCFCFECIATQICKRNLPKETFYKIIALLGVEVK